MREHVKAEVAMEILSMCMARAVSNSDEKMINELSEIKQKVYQGNIKKIDEIIKKYGKQIKNILEDSNE